MRLTHKPSQIGLAILLVISGFLLTFTLLLPNSSASTTFSSGDISGPSGYFKSARAQFAFHWKNVKTKQGIQTVLIFGDFQKPQIQTAIPTGNKISANKKTFYSTYRLINSNGKLQPTETSFKIIQLGKNRYQVHIATTGTGRIAKSGGKSYTFTRTKTSPAKTYANAYSKRVLNQRYTNQLNANLEKQYQAAKQKGENIKDPATDPDIQAKVKSTAATATARSIKNIIKAFNY